MVFLRVVTDIRRHFEARIAEWALAVYLLNYGLGLLSPGSGWTQPAAWAGMTQYLTQGQWGTICVAIGLLRLVALAINGTFADTLYARYSPTVRGICAGLSATFWFMVILSLSAVPSVGSRAYLLPFGLEIWCIFHAWRDDGRQRSRGRKSGLAR
jgi:hypothetical protein